MRYSIIANPSSGKMNLNQKLSTLVKASEILDSEIHGLDTSTADEFCQCAKKLASRCEVLVIAGGDGTFSDIINSIDTAHTPVAYLPLGTGNAMRHALQYKGSLTDIALRIRDGKIHEYDLINCDDKVRAFMVSVGIEGVVIRLWNQYLDRGGNGLKTHLKAIINSYFKEYKRAAAKIAIDGKSFEIKNLLSIMVVKQPYYGFGMKVVPKALFNDRRLHIVCTNAKLFKSVLGVISAFTIGNRIGQYNTGLKVIANLDRPLALQFDGNEGWEAETFTFTVLPKALKIKC